MKSLSTTPVKTSLLLLFTCIVVGIIAFSGTATAGPTLIAGPSGGQRLNDVLPAQNGMLLLPGDLDPTFDGDGRVTTDFIIGSTGSKNEARAVAIQPDGKIVTAGTVRLSGNNYNFGVTRHNPDGSLDTGFSGDGRLTTDLGYNLNDPAYGMAIQADGKIVVVGVRGDTHDIYNDFGIVRYNNDGTLDTNFDGDGIANVNFGDYYDDRAYAVAIQTDGKIVVAGYSVTASHPDYSFAVARLNTNGSLDNSFDGDGRVGINFFGGFDKAFAVAIQDDGKIVVAGSAQIANFNYDFALARLNTNGSLDSTFDGDGKLTTDFFGQDDAVLAMAIQADGRIVTAGTFRTTGTDYDFGLARYLYNGTLDTSFDGDGLVSFNFVPGVAEEIANGVAIQADGKIVVAGYALCSYAGPCFSNYDFALARLNLNGSLDTGFSEDGLLVTDFAGSNDRAYAVAIQADGKIVAAGTGYMGGSNLEDFALARYQFGSSPPPPAPTATPTLKPSVPTATPTIKPNPNPTATSTVSPTDSRYFSQTGHTVKGLFLNYWENHGGLAQQGYPITEEMLEVSDTDGKTYTMQYFERAVFENHPENAPPYNVLLSLLGVSYYNQKYGGNAPNQHANADNPRQFTQTGKTIGGGFRQYWESHGGLAQQGYPISDEFQEVSATDGKTYTVQYFERAVFEFHPENPPPYNVLLSLLGVFYKDKKHPGP